MDLEALKNNNKGPEISDWLNQQKSANVHAVRADVDISVVIPAYNEQWRIPATLIAVIDYFDKLVTKDPKLSYEIIVANDGSTDETVELVHKFEKIRTQVRLISLARNRGKGEAVKTGMLNARGKYVLFCDADGATPIEEFERLKKAIDEGSDVSFGSRAMFSDETKVKTVWYRKIIGRVFNLFVNSLIIGEVKDTQCGFKLFTKESCKFLFERQKLEGFAFDVEILYLAKKSGMKIKEVPVNWQNVAGSKVDLVFDSAKMFLELVKIFFIQRKVDTFVRDIIATK